MTKKSTPKINKIRSIDIKAGQGYIKDIADNTIFIRVTPVKSLFHSTTVYEVINRGSIFAVDLSTGNLTIHKGDIDVIPVILKLIKEETKAQ